MKYPVADAHCDFLYYMVQEGADISKKNHYCINLPDMLAGGVALQCCAAWVDSKLRASPLQQVLTMADAYHNMLANNRQLTVLTREFAPGPECGQVAVVLTVEGGEAIEGRLENLRILHRLGVRAMTLTWNETNELASPAMRRVNKGLTAFGRSVVGEMDRIGIALDVAHLSDAGIDDALELMRRPIYASHSNARAVCQHKRSLSDRHIREISRCGGVVCVNFYGPQLNPSGVGNIADVVKHIMHVIEIGGIGCAAFGSDFDGMTAYPRDLKNPSFYPQLIEALSAAGLSDEALYRVCYANLRDYLVKFCK